MQCKMTCLARGFAMSMLAAGLVLGGSKLAMAGLRTAARCPPASDATS